jgi:16S rRNA processing protein RimM
MKKKKNKYAKFSKVEQIEKDPFEALIEESERKLKSIQEEKQLDPIRRQEQAIIEQGGKILTQKEQEKLRLQFPNTTEINPYDATSFGYMEIGTIIGPHGVHGWTRVQGETDYPERLTSAGMILHLKPPRRRAPRKVTLASGKQIEPNVFLIQLQGIYNRTAASKLKGAVLYYATQQDTTINKDEGEMLLSDLVGLTVYKRRAPEDSTSDQYDDISCKSNTNGVIVGKVLGFVLGEEMCGIPGLFHDQLEIQLIDDDEDNEDNEGIVPDQGRDPNSGSGGDGANRQGRKRLERKRRPPPKLVMIPMVPEIVTKVDLDGQSIVIDPPAGLLDLTYEREEKVQIKGLLAPASDD